MFERFTEHGVEVIILGQGEARRYNCPSFGTEHILLGLLAENSGVGYIVLDRCGLTLFATREQTVKRLDLMKYNINPPVVDIGFTNRAKRVVQNAITESEGFLHSYVGTEHVLMSFLLENDGAGIIILDALSDFGLDRVRTETIKEMRISSEGPLPLNIPSGRRPLSGKTEWEPTYAQTLQFEANDEHFQMELAHKRRQREQEHAKETRSDLLLTKKIKDFEKRGYSPLFIDFFIPAPIVNDYTFNLTQMASEQLIDPVVGRIDEVNRVIQILARRRKNNAVLVGEPGVGKTAVAEGLAIKILTDDVPNELKGKMVLSLDLGLLIAGSKYRGEFEQRFKFLIMEFQQKSNYILVVDEIHTLVGSGSAEGSMDAANILKPALARGEIQCVGATTKTEYRQYIERDPALERRFQQVQVNEPTILETVSILIGLRQKYENHHLIRLTGEALLSAAQMSSKYIADRFLPDKAIDLVDEACARVRLGFEVVPEICKKYEKAILDNHRQRCEAVADQDYATALVIVNNSYSIFKEFKLVLETLIQQFEIDEKHWTIRAIEQRYQKVLVEPDHLMVIEDALFAIINEERNVILINEKVLGSINKENSLDVEIVDDENDESMDFDEEIDEEILDVEIDEEILDVEIVDDENDEPMDFDEEIYENIETKLAAEAKHLEELKSINKDIFEKTPPEAVMPRILEYANTTSITSITTREFLVTSKHDKIDEDFFLKLLCKVLRPLDEPRITQIYFRLITLYGSKYYHTEMMPTYEAIKQKIDAVVLLHKHEKEELIERQLELDENETRANLANIERDNYMLSIFKEDEETEVPIWYPPDPNHKELLVTQEIETLNFQKLDYLNSLEQLKSIKQLKNELRSAYSSLLSLNTMEMNAVASNDVINGLRDVISTTTLDIKIVNLIFYIKFRKANMRKDSYPVCKFISWDFFNILDAYGMLLLAQDSIFYFKKSLIKTAPPADYESGSKFILRKKMPKKMPLSLFVTNSAVEILNQMGIYLGICLPLSINIWPIDIDDDICLPYIFHPRLKDAVIRDFVLNTNLKLLKHDLFLIFSLDPLLKKGFCHKLKGKNNFTFIMSQLSKKFITFSLEKETLKTFLATDKAFLSLDKKFFYKLSEDIKLDYIASDTVNHKLIIPKFGLYNPIYKLIPVPVIFYAELLDFHEYYLDLIMQTQLSTKLYKTKVQSAMNEEMSLEDKHYVGLFFSQLDENHMVSGGYTKDNVIYAQNELLKEKLQLLRKPEPALPSSFTPYVFASDVAKVVSDWTGIPAESVTKKETEELIDLEGKLADRVIGQMNAIISISRALRRARVGLRSLNRPIASFLFCGPTGVGKTEVTKALAYFYFGSESIMVRFDMSEFMEKHSISKLIGSPPGYVGYADGGQLTEAVRMKPYIVVLFDEVEKAHPDIFNILLQVLDDGRLTDSQGRVVDFKNTIIIMTSNLGSAQIQEPEKFKDQLEPNSSLNGTKSTDDEDLIWNKTENEVISELVNRALKNFFRPEFINRIDEVVIFNKLSKENLEQIATIALSELSTRLLGKNFHLVVSNPARKQLVDEGFDPKFGARPLRRVITQRLEDSLAYTILTENLQPYSTLLVDVDSLGDFIITGKSPYPVKDEEYKKYVKQVEDEVENLPPRFSKANRALYKRVFTVRKFDYPDGVVIDENEPVEVIPNFGIGWPNWAIFKDEDFSQPNWWLPK
jgi:ATP-dependent Clp protease ATP-binding subunit ClpA